MEPKSTDFVQSLERGLSVIRAFDVDNPHLTLSEVAQRTDLTRAAARRFLLTLQRLGYVRSDRKHFSLRPRVLELGYAYLSSLGLPEVAMPHLEQVVAEVQLSSSVSVLDDQDIIYVARVMTRRIMSVNINVGTRLPAASTSMGRVLLAGLDEAELDEFLDRAALIAHTASTVVDRAALRGVIAEVREAGWAMVDQELELGLRAIAVPIRDAQGKTVAAMNLSAPAVTVTADEVVERFLEPLQRHAQAIEEDFRVVDRS
ncbi:IclR family transcriptional regulator domain-containing protein [Microbacterium tumbae]